MATYIIVSRWNCWLISIWLGWILVLIGVSLSTLLVRTESVAIWVSSAMLLGTGVGILYPSLHTASELIAAVDDDEMKRRSVTNYAFFHILGKAFGIGIAASVFENELFRHLKNAPAFRPFARQYTNNAVALVVRIRSTPGGEGSPKVEIVDAYVNSLKAVWITIAVFVAIALIASVLGRPKEPEVQEADIEIRIDEPPPDVELRSLDKSYVV
jgi:fucose permease